MRVSPQLRRYSTAEVAQLVKDGRALYDVVSDTFVPLITGSAFTEIQSVKGGDTSTGNLTITVPAGGFAAGHHLILTCYYRVATATMVATTPTDTGSNTWHLDDTNSSTANGQFMASVYLTTALAAGNTIVITFSGSGSVTSKAWKITECTGLETTNWWDVTPVRGSDASTPIDIPAVTPTAGDRLVFTHCGDISSSTVSSVSGGFTQAGTRQSNAGPTNNFAAYKAATYNGSTAETGAQWTMSANLSGARQVTAVYKIAITSFPQKLRGERDASNSGGYTDNAGGSTNLVSKINEASFDDATYVQSPGLTPGGAHKIWRWKINAGNPPQSGSHILKTRYREDAAGADTVNLKSRLYQGGGNVEGAGTLIAERTYSAVGATVVEDDYTLSGGEVSSITNYGDLWREFEAWAT